MAGEDNIIKFEELARYHVKLKNYINDLLEDYPELTDLAAVALSGEYADLAGQPDIPDELKDLQDDSTHRLVSDSEKATWNGKQNVLIAGDNISIVGNVISAIGGTITIIANPSGSASGELSKLQVGEEIYSVVTKAVNDLSNYYLKADTYTKTEVNQIVGAISTITIEAVNTLPTTDIKTNVIYLVPSSDPEAGNVKDEYINLNGTSSGWEKIGSTDIDLSNYVTNTALSTTLANYVPKSATPGLLKNDGTVDTNTYLTSVPTATSSTKGILAYDGNQFVMVNDKLGLLFGLLEQGATKPPQAGAVYDALQAKQDDVGLLVKNGKLCVRYSVE